MQNFVYYTPTKVVFGRNTVEKTGELLKEQGAGKVLLHYGGASALKSGLVDRVRTSLREAGIYFVELSGVKPNPRISLAREGVELCRKEGVDFLLPIGGGSVIDSAKAIGYGLANNCDPWCIYDRSVEPAGCAPIGVVLTIAASGSEMSDSSVLTNEDGWLKRGFNHDCCRPRFAVMDPELTYTLPPYQTACGVTDIMMHTMERYFSNEPHTELTDAIAEGLLRTVMHCGRVLMKDPLNYDARAEIMWAGSLSHNGLTGCGTIRDFASHQLEHELSGMYDVAHGAGLAAVWGSWARYVYKANVQKFVQFAVNVMGVDLGTGSAEEVALAGISAAEDYFRFLGMPTSLSELGIHPGEAEIKELTEKCVHFGKRTIGGFMILSAPDVEKIYRMAL